MKYMIHGMVDRVNFGDYLFANIFYKHLTEEAGQEIYFYEDKKHGISDFLRKDLSYKGDPAGKEKADGLIYIPGGYFGDTSGSLKDSFVRYKRYFVIGDYFRKKGKPIYICGVGGGPLVNKHLRKRAVRIMNSASAICVRDPETKEYFEKNGVTVPIKVTTDAALLIRNMTLPELDKDIRSKIDSTAGGRKLLFFHIARNDKLNVNIREKIVPALNRFLEAHKDEYCTIVGTDQPCEGDITEMEVYKQIKGVKMPYCFYDTMQMAALLSSVDCVVTARLHVGIVSSVYGKCVVSIAGHINKTKRFYKQIGEPDRCALLKDVSEDEIVERMEKYLVKKASVPDELIKKASENFESIPLK